MRSKVKVEDGYNENDDHGDKSDESDINEGEAEGYGQDNKGYYMPTPSLSLDFQAEQRAARVSTQKPVRCRARLRMVSASPSNSDEIDPRARGETEEDQTSKRDDERCVVIKMGGPYEVAHIYPFCSNQHTDQSALKGFWQTLSVFWSEDQVKTWKTAVMGKKGTESPMNMLTLSPTVRRLWVACFFALKPIRTSKRRLIVEFHWLQPRPKGEKPLLVNARICPDCLAEIDSPGQDIRLLHSPSKTIITSGTRIAIHTDDPQKRPLPSFALLEMQWNLQMVAALSGKAKWQDEDYGDSDDDADATGVLSLLDDDDIGEYDDFGDDYCIFGL